MKFFITLYLLFSLNLVKAQTERLKMLMDSAKAKFKSVQALEGDDYYNFDYSELAKIFEEVVAADSNNAEARYFLGYTYGRMNSRDAESMPKMNLDLLLKTSSHFEAVIRLSPKYKGEIIVLDPYSKITAEWGSMAFSYLYKDKVDSAVWALKEGKRRGGYSNYMLETNRHCLATCKQRAILMTSGDNFIFPLMYLQLVENYRTDVSVIDVSVLGSSWYASYLSRKNLVRFDLPAEKIDSIGHIETKDTLMTIGKFSWIVKPSYYGMYLLRGDLLFLSLLKANNFEREVFFTLSVPEENMLGLTENIVDLVFVKKLALFFGSGLSFDTYRSEAIKALKLSKLINSNTVDEYVLLDNYRYGIFHMIDKYLRKDEKEEAKELLWLIDEYANEREFPYNNQSGKEYADYIREFLN